MLPVVVPSSETALAAPNANHGTSVCFGAKGDSVQCRYAIT